MRSVLPIYHKSDISGSILLSVGRTSFMCLCPTGPLVTKGVRLLFLKLERNITMKCMFVLWLQMDFLE